MPSPARGKRRRFGLRRKSTVLWLTWSRPRVSVYLFILPLARKSSMSITDLAHARPAELLPFVPRPCRADDGGDIPPRGKAAARGELVAAL